MTAEAFGAVLNYSNVRDFPTSTVYSVSVNGQAIPVVTGATTTSAAVAVKVNGGSPCDLNADGSVTVIDVQQVVNQALGMAPCTADLDKNGQCNIVEVQRVTNAALGGACVAN